MTESDKKLERLAKAATSGPWEYASSVADWNMPILHIIKARGVAILEIEGVMPSPIGGSSKERQRFADAAYVAAANPQTVLALLERVAAAESACERMGQALTEANDSESALIERVRELEASCAVLEEQLDVKLEDFLPKGTARLTLEELELILDRLASGRISSPVIELVQSKIKEAKGE